MTDQFVNANKMVPITPPPELVEQWFMEGATLGGPTRHHLATQAARWGADQELEACCADIHTVHGQHRADWLRSMRRPKPPSLKEQALVALQAITLDVNDTKQFYRDIETIKTALEQLDA